MTEGISFSPSPVFYVIIGLILGLIAGWVIGFFDSNSRSAKKIEVAEKNAEIKIQEAEKKIRMADEKAAQSALPPAAPDDPGLLRLNHDHSLELDGMHVEGALPPEKKKRLIDLLTIIRPYLEGGAPAKPAPSVEKTPQTPPPAVSFPRAATQPKPAAARPSAPGPVAPVKPTLASVLAPSKKAEDEQPAVSLSIVGQIDSVLQARLENSPLAGRGISLHEAPDGSVEVIVGAQKFPSIDDVTDEAVKTAIRAAIAEWEQKF